MKESRLTPFDAETFLMIESVIGKEPEVKEKEKYFELKLYNSEKPEYVIEAAINAVCGRYGKRLKETRLIKEYIFLRGATFFVEYEKGEENLPNELRTNLGMPDETAGDIYCRRLLEIRALPVKRDNLEKLLMFTGGGTMQIPRTPGGLAVYSFPTENGVMLDVPEGNFIVLTPDGKFGKMDMQTFMANFEEKDANSAGLTFGEKRLFEKMFHIAALFGYSQRELQEMAYTKIAGREKKPDFMRTHPHNENERPVPGNTKQETAEEYKHFDQRFNQIL